MKTECKAERVRAKTTGHGLIPYGRLKTEGSESTAWPATQTAGAVGGRRVEMTIPLSSQHFHERELLGGVRAVSRKSRPVGQSGVCVGETTVGQMSRHLTLDLWEERESDTPCWGGDSRWSKDRYGRDGPSQR